MKITEIERFWGLRGLEHPQNHLKLKFGRTPPAAPADVILSSGLEFGAQRRDSSEDLTKL